MFPPGAASLVTASNLNTSLKAAVRVDNFTSSEITIGGVPISAADISGVVTSVAYFLPQEFYYIEPADREYVCSEVRAFFIYFLSELRCRKLNPPTPKTLSGLGMHRIEWMKAAFVGGIPVWPRRLKSGELVEGDEQPLRRVKVTIIGDTIIEDGAPEQVRAYVVTLSRLFAMPYLCADFVSPHEGKYFLAELRSVPDITVAANREAVVRFMGRPA